MASRNDLEQLSPGEKRALLKQLLERGKAPSSQPNVVSDAGPVRRPAHEAPVPSSAQERMWFLEQLSPGSAAYNVPRAVELEGDVNAQVLDAALRQLLARHTALRSTFPFTNDGPRLTFLEVPTRALEEEDLSATPEGEREALLARRLREEATRPFPLEKGPLYRFRLLRVAPRRHVFLLVMHHLVMDGWSLNVMMRELGALYEGLGRQQVPQLPVPPLEYADLAAWQRSPGAAAREASHLEYWKRQLADAPPLLELPTDKPRPEARSDVGAQTEPLPLSPALSETVRAFCRERQVTPFMAFYAVFAALLHRYSQQTDLCVGTPVAGRTHHSAEGVVGLFVNTVVLRDTVTSTLDFSTLLSQVRETTRAAYSHQEAPFERVVEALHVERSLRWTPLFQVMFDLYQEERSLADAFPGLRSRPVHVDTGAAQFDLGLTVTDGASGFTLSVQYSTELFEPDTVQRLLGHYVRMLEHALAAPGTKVGELALLSPAERQQVLSTFNDTERPFDSEATLVSLFEAQVARTPDAPAVVAPEGTLTFRELATQASRLAAHLVAAGARPEAVVGLCLERSLDAVVSLFAIFMSGAGCLPLEATHPAARRAALLRQSGARLVVSRATLFEGETLDVPLVSPDVRAQEAVPSAPPVRARAEHLAYLLYTSGSTGEPKGAELSHRNVVHAFAAFAPYYQTQPGDCWASSGSLSFDIHLEELLFSITRGARTVLREVGPLGLGRDILRHGITHIVMTPSSLATALEEPGALEAVRTLKVLVTGGEVLPDPLVRQLALERTKLVNTYGPTETSVIVVAEFSRPERPVRLGRPLERCRMYVLDAQGEPVPPGVPGELYIGGTPVGRGYRGRPDLTAERFVPDTFSGIPGARLYRTGDRGKWNADGTLSFLGRTDFQVKVRGVRIEPEEIEAALLRQPGVRQAAVGVRGSGRDTRLEAFFVVEGESAAATKRLREALKQALPEAMVPSRFVSLPALPFTTNGKVDRKALLALPVEESEQGTEGQLPRGPVEELLAQLFAQVLGVERVQRDDDFFQRGGHSLGAIRLVARVRHAFGVELQLGAIFSAPSVARLAREVSQLQASTEALPAPTALPAGAAPEFSFAQESMWFLQQLQPDSSAFHMAEAVELQGQVNAAALEEALRLVLTRHSVLRTTVSSVEGRPLPRVQALPSRVLHVESLSDTSALDARMRQELDRSFSLETGPLYRFFLWQLAPERQVLLLVFHHLLMDGLSLGLVLRELGHAYAALRQGQQPSLPAPLQYSDVVAWQRSPAVQAREARQLEYWRQQLADAPRLLQLPTDRPRPSVLSDRGSSTSRLSVSPALVQTLGALCRQHQVTPFMVLQAAFSALLHRYSGQQDLCIGTPASGRTHPSTEDVVGLFANTVVLRARLEPATTFSGLLAHVRATALEAFAHQDVPFDRIVSGLGVERSLSHAPLVQVAFAWNHAGRSFSEDVPGLTTRLLPLPASGAKFDLALSVYETSATSLELEAEYRSDLFDASTAQRLLSHYLQLLEHAVRAPGTRLDSLRLLSEDERHFVLRACNETQQPPLEQDTVVSLLSTHARQTPHKVALSFEGGRWTYAELDSHTTRVARRLTAQGVGPESLVALVGPRTEATLRAVLSVHKAGGAFLPLESRLPPARIAQVLAESRAPFALALGGAESLLEQALALLPEAQRPRVLSLTGWEAESPEPSARRDSPDALAYVLFTSGSTGVPKGVMIEQRGLLNHILGMKQALGLGAEDVIAQTAALSFDISVWQMLGAFTFGATTRVFEDEVVREPLRLAEALDAAEVTTVQLVPSVLQAMLEDGASGALPSFARLRRMVTIGEALPPAVCRAWFERYPSIPLHNAYGPAECSDTATVHPLHEAPARASTPIGTPKVNMEVYVLDEALQPVPVGVVGELYIGGVGVGRGYRHRPELTAERFVPHPFSQRPGARLYRTGDLGRRLADGVLEFVARTDFQVKVRGMRIELAEIESALHQLPAVRSAVVMARERRPGDKYLVAFAVPAEASVSEDSLREALARALPGYMVPARFALLDALPLSPNGKVDRKALAALPVEESTQGTSEGQPPRGPVEELLAQLFTQVLGVERVQRQDDFFQRGGHSLSATRLVARVRQSFGVELPLGTIFSSPSVEGLARALSGLQGSAIQEAPAARPAGTEPVLSFSQERMWFLQQLQPDSSAYHVAEAVELQGQVHASTLEEALRRVLTRHSVLRTTFSSMEGRPLPRVQPLPSRVLHVESLSGPAALDARMRQELDRVFPLETGPLYRFFLWQLAPERQVLMLVFHHLLVDGLSVGVLLRELGSAYVALRQGQQPSLPASPLQYSDVAAWQRSPAAQAREARQLEYWRQQLADAPRLLQLPTDRPRPSVLSDKGGSTSRLPLSPALVQALGTLCRQHQVTPFMALQAAFSALLSRYSGQQDVSVGTPVSGRTHPSTEDVVGLFANTVVLRTRLESDTTFSNLLSHVRATSLEAFAHQDVPFERVVSGLGVERSPSHSPLFQVAFTWNHATHAFTEAGTGLTARALPVTASSAKFDLALLVHETQADSLELEIEYSADLFDASTARRLLGHYLQLLEHALRAPHTRVDALELLSQQEREELARSFREPQRPFDTRATVVSLFEAQVARAPEAQALIASDASLSYRQLDERATALAGQLSALGAGPESVIGVCLERTSELLVAMLAILKAGAAYLPMEGSHPLVRRTTLLRSAGARLVVARPESFPEELSGITRVAPETRGPVAQLRAPLPENLAMVLFTSGTTGEPKAVEVSHRNLCHLFEAADTSYPSRPGDTTLAAASVAFDVHLAELLYPLARGARVILRETGPLGLGRDIVQHRATHLLGTPSVITAALEEPEATEAFRQLSLLQLGGESPPESLVQRLSGGRVQVLNGYGPSETTCITTLHPLRQGVPIRLGRPVDRARLYVLDAYGKPTAPGVPGELCIGGEGVSRGYRGRPDLTAERFVPDPFSGVPGARLYRTGDRVKWNTDGTLSFLGRTDLQVKVRGMRIELEEIEAALLRQPGVRQAAVLARQDARETRLEAFLSFQGDTSGAEETLRTALASALPAAMVPSRIVVLDTLPLTPTGKVDRKALAALPVAAPAPRAASEPPRGAVERLVAELFRQLLGTEHVGRDDHFFELGGHSMNAAQLAARLRRTLGVELPLSTIFAAPTVAGLAARLATAPRHQEVLRPGPRAERVPASLVQERLWFALQLPDAPPYSVVLPLVLEGALDTEKLESSLRVLLENNEALRCTFYLDAETVYAWPNPVSGPVLARTDLSHLPPEQALEQARAIVTRHDVQPFDALHGPMYRFELLKLDATGTRHVLVTAGSHLVVDYLGLQAFLDELAVAYRAALAGQPLPAPAPVQYADFVRWQRDPEHQVQLDASLESWKQALAHAPPVLDLPLDFPRRAPATNANMRAVRLSLRGGDVAQLRELARSEGVSFFTAVVALMQAWLHRLSAQTHVVIASPFSGRGLPQTEHMVGYFTNVLPLCTDLSREPSFRALLQRVQDVVSHASDHQELPFKRIADAVQPDADRTAPPLAQALLQLDSLVTPRFEGLSTSLLGTDSLVIPAYDVVLSLIERADGGLNGVLSTDSALFTSETAARMAGALAQLLSETVQRPDVPLSRLSLLSTEQRAQVLASLDGGPQAVPAGACVHTLFEAQVRRTPQAPAVAHGSSTWSYAELNARANLLAAKLVAQGLQPEERVGVVMEPSTQALAVLLGILKAGGAYVPLDPGWPEARKLAVLERAGVKRLWVEPTLLADHHGLVPLVEVPPQPAEVAEDLGPGPRTVSDSQLAYIIFTSGSTGEPKGVMVEHCSVVNHNLAIAARFGLRPGDRMLQFAPLSFDAAAEDLYPPLAVGGTVVMRSGLVPAHAMTPYLEETGITIISLPPTYIEEWVREMESQGQRVPPRLRLLAPGGDVLKRETYEGWLYVGGLHAPWVNVYGPTECTITSATCDIPGAEGVGTAPTFPIGRPIPRVRFYLLDEHFQPVLPGLPGKVYIGGAALSRGYLDAPHQTSERFVPDPFSREPGARMYHTGDLARLLPDGRLRFLGRADHQVKIRGFRIELSEIENCLRRFAGVEEAVVLARTSAAGVQQLCAYVQAPKAVQADALRTHVAEQLPSYMVPAAFVVMERLPINNNGKVDRHALPDPDAVPAAAPQAAQGDGAPKLETPFRSTLEMQMQRLWSDVLHLPVIKPEDDFFALGGDSILAMRLLGRMEEELGIPVPLATLFQSPILKETVDAVRELLEEGPPRSSVVRLSGPDTPADAPAIFFLHPSDGELHHYRFLTPLLESRYRCFGIQAPETVSRAGLATFEERIAAYMRDIQAVQPHGPYRIIGYSYGGYPALGLAAALEAAGEEVKLLAMLDTLTFQAMAGLSRRPDVTPPLIIAEEFEVLNEELERELATLPLGEQWNLVAARARAKGTAAPHFQGKDLARMWYILGEVLVPQVRDWQVKTPRARLLLFRAEVSLAVSGDETLGWGQHLPREQIDVAPIAGSHFGVVLPPVVNAIVERLLAELEK